MHLIPLIHDLAVILGVAGLVSLIFQKIKQPVVLGYILAGAIVGPHTPPYSLVSDLPSIRTWGELGVIFLMFSLGLEFSFRKLARVGITAGTAATVEVLFMIPLGFVTGRLFGWSPMDSLFLGAMLSISSTTIIIKALDELKLKTRRFAEMIFAILIVEDLFAILILVALSTIAMSNSFSPMSLLGAGLKLILVVGGWFITGYLIIPRIMKFVGKIGSPEIMTIVAVALCLGLVVFATHFEYSPALGAFIMGSILAETPELHRIEERIAPLRDLFAAVFFVSVGMLIDFQALINNAGAIAVICAVTLIGKIVSVTLGTLLSGQDFKNSVRVGLGLAQIGEFSFIIAGLGLTLQVTSDFIYPTAVAVSLVTTFTTPYLIRSAEPFAEFLEKHLPPSLLAKLDRYSSKSRRLAYSEPSQLHFQRRLLRWFINGLAVSVIIFGGARILDDSLGSPTFSWLIAISFASPFLWGMITAFSNQSATPIRSKLVFGFNLLTVIWISAISARYFPVRIYLLVGAILMTVILFTFHGHLGSFYSWFERHFLSTFQTPGKPMDKLAPWDAHLVKIKVHPNALIVGKRLKQTELRAQGLNIVAIQRGLKTIIGPHPDELIMSEDELLVLGTDEQIESLRVQIENPYPGHEAWQDLSDYEMKPVQIQEGSTLVGQSLKTSCLRERFETNIVGLERDGKRSLRLHSDLILQASDILWTVGEIKNLDKLALEARGTSP